MRLNGLIIIFLLGVGSLNAQSSLNGYKYVIVPKKFDFQKTEDKYELNSLTKFLFDKEGFITLFDSEKIPQELYKNPCMGLKAIIKDESNMLMIKVVIELIDCSDDTVMTSIEGKSKIKELKRGYQEAVRRAFQSVKNLNYKYDGSLPAATKKLQEPDNKGKTLLVETVAVEAIVPKTNSEEVALDKIDGIEEEVSQTTPKTIENTNATGAVLYAQAKPYGFQLVDSTPKVVYLLQKSSLKDVYILKNKNGIIHKVNGIWIAEYYESNTLIKMELTIKF